MDPACAANRQRNHKKGRPSFTTTDLDGNPVDESIFAQSDLTVLNVWGTFCSPCIGEIPELGEWARALPANVRLYGLVSDITSLNDTDQIALAKKIMQKANADYVTSVPMKASCPSWTALWACQQRSLLTATATLSVIRSSVQT